jgi:hypothetical protein
MKKKVLLLLMVFTISTAVFADHEGFGIGIIGGGGWGYPHYGNIGLSLKIPKVPVFWGFYPTFDGHNFGFGATGDFYFVDTGIKETLHWFLGVGAFINLSFWHRGMAASIGVRVPVGLSWHIIKQLELFLDIAPGAGISFSSAGVHGPYFAGAIELGLRFWV